MLVEKALMTMFYNFITWFKAKYFKPNKSEPQYLSGKGRSKC